MPRKVGLKPSSKSSNHISWKLSFSYEMNYGSTSDVISPIIIFFYDDDLSVGQVILGN
jgi:hypothetical protein